MPFPDDSRENAINKNEAILSSGRPKDAGGTSAFRLLEIRCTAEVKGLKGGIQNVPFVEGSMVQKHLINTLAAVKQTDS